MTIEQLKVLDAVVKHGSLMAAAKVLHKTQPALSQALKKLEQQAGVSLLQRENQRVTLTQAGEAFLMSAEQVLMAYERLQTLTQHLARGNEAELRIAYETSGPFELMLSHLSQCQQRFPDTQMTLLSASRFAAMELLMQGKADIAISPWFPVFHGLENLDTTLLRTFNLKVVAAPELLPQWNGKVVPLAELNHLPEIVLHSTNLPFDSEKLRLNAGGRRWLVQDNSKARDLVKAGLGWGCFADFMVSEALAKGELVELNLKELTAQINVEVHAIRKSNTSHGPVAEFLWQAFRQAPAS